MARRRAALRFLREVRPASHARDIDGMRASGEPEMARVLRALAAAYASSGRIAWGRRGPCLSRLAAVRRLDVGRRRMPCCRCWRPRPACACRSPRRSTRTASASAPGAAASGCPNCAHAAWLDPLLEELGVHACCVDLSDVLSIGAPEQLRPLRSPRARCSCRSTVPRSSSSGAPPATRRRRPTATATCGRCTTITWHANDGALYDEERAVQQARADAHHCRRKRPRTAARWLREARAPGAGGLRAGHRAARPLVARRGCCGSRKYSPRPPPEGLEIVALDDALAAPAAENAPQLDEPLPVTSWGTPRTLDTWSGPAGGGARLARARRRAGRARSGRSRPRRARCASCSPCSPAIGRSSPRDGSPATTGSSAPPRTPSNCIGHSAT